MINLTKEEAIELYNNNYKDIKVKFSSYYKYSFGFSGENDNIKIYISFGGTADDIYRFDVHADELCGLGPFEKLSDNWNYINITRKSDNLSYGESFDW